MRPGPKRAGPASRAWRALASAGTVVLAALGLAACEGQTQFSRNLNAGWVPTALDVRAGDRTVARLEMEWNANSSTRVSLALGAPSGVTAKAAAKPECTGSRNPCRDSVTVEIAIDADAAPRDDVLLAEAYLDDQATPMQSFLGAALTDRSAAALRLRIFAAGSPDAPTGLAAAGQKLAVALTWNADPAVTRYELERQGPGALPDAWTPVATLPAGSTGYTDTGLAADTRYRYRLVPYGATGRGPEAGAEARTLVGSGPRTFALQLTVDGSGSGRVTSTPPGIDCPGACRADFSEGSTVALAAAPAAGGVVNWSGSTACSGSALRLDVPITGSTFCRASFSATPPAVPPGWTSAGSVRTVPGVLGAPAIVFDDAGALTVAWVEDGGGSDRGALRVARQRGGAWLLVSADPVNAGGPSATASPALVLGDSGEPVVAWTNADGEMRIAAWDGSAWAALGGGNLATGGRATPASAPQLQRSSETFVAAWTEATGSGSRIVVKQADRRALASPWTGGPVPGASSSGGAIARLALDAGGSATVLVLRTGLSGQELPLRAYDQALGWQAICGDLGSASGLANSAVGFAIQRDRLRDGSAVALRTSPDYRRILGARCVGGAWVPLGLQADGTVAEVDNIGRVLRQVVMLPERAGRGPVALVSIDDGYRRSTTFEQAVLGAAGFDAATGLDRPRIARVGALGAAPIGAGAIGFVQGFESGAAVELEVWRFSP